MKLLFSSFWLVMAAGVFSGTAFAYGSSGGAKACERPAFSKFQPLPGASVEQFGDFSFTATPNTAAASIEVTVSTGGKQQRFSAGSLQINPQPNGYLVVSGHLATPLSSGFARINIAAASRSGCTAADGYLVKISGNKAN